MGPADLETIGIAVVAVDLIELALAPGLDILAEAGGLAGFTGWRGPIIALSRARPARSGGGAGSAGWRARGLPLVLGEQDGDLTVRSPIDGSTRHLSRDQLAGAAITLGATPVADLQSSAGVAWWDAAEVAPPTSGWVVSAIPAEAARAGRYLTAAGWREIDATADAAAPGPLVEGCPCRACRVAQVGYIAHLWRQREITATHLLGWHNQHQARLLLDS